MAARKRPRRCLPGSPRYTHLGASSSGSHAPLRIFLPALPLRLQHPRIPLAPAGSARSIFTSWDASGHAPSSLSLAMTHASHSLIGGGQRSPCKSCCSRRHVDWLARGVRLLGLGLSLAARSDGESDARRALC